MKNTSRDKADSLEKLMKISYKIAIPEIFQLIQILTRILSGTITEEVDVIIRSNISAILVSFLRNLDKIEKQDSIDFIDAFCNAIKYNVINETYIRFSKIFTEMIEDHTKDGKQ